MTAGIGSGRHPANYIRAALIVLIASVAGSPARAQTLPGVTWTTSTQKPVTGSTPQSIAVGDFNGDGIADIAVGQAGSLGIFLGNGDGTFKPADTANDGITISAPLTGTVAIAAAAFQKGKPVSIVAVSASYNATILSDGKGGEMAPNSFSGIASTSVATGDLNGDGNPDIVVAGTSFQNPVAGFYLNPGNGVFTTPTIIPIDSNSPGFVAVGDFLGNGKLDLAVTDNNLVDVLLNDGSGNFSQGVGGTAGNGPSGIAVGDFNGDGKQDLAVVNQADGTVSVLLSNGDTFGTFTASATVKVGNSPSAIVAGDFNKDGKTDLAVTNSGDNTVTILLGNGNGTFATPATLPVGKAPSSLAVGNFTGNGDVDLAVTNSSDNTVTILLPQAAPTITTQPVSQTINNGGTVVYTVTAGGSVQSSLAKPIGPVAMTSPATTYQWQLNGVNLTDGSNLAGSTGPQLVIQGATAADDGSYACVVTVGGASVTSNAAMLSVTTSSNPGLANSISTRAFVGTGDNLLIGGFFVVGSTSRTVLVQGLGPALGQFGVTGFLAHPTLSIHQTQNGSDVTLYSNTGWGSGQVLLNAAASVFASPTLPANSPDSELLLTLPPGGYSAEVSGADGGSGVALCAIYELP